MGLLKNQDPKARLVGRVFIVFILALMLNYVWVVLASRIYLVVNASLLGKTINKETVLQLINTPFFLFLMALYNILVAIAVFLFWHRYDKREFADMGVVWDYKAPSMLCKGMLLALAGVAAVTVIGLITGAVQYTGTGFAEYDSGTVLSSLIFGILTFAVIAFGEEVLYRGYMLRNFADASDNGTAIFFAAALYVFGHITICHDTFDFINIFLFGLILGYAFLQTKSLYMSIGFHFIWRLFNAIVLNIQSLGGAKGVTLFVLQSNGDIVLKGKQWGTRLEFITFLVELIIFIALYIIARKKEGTKTKNKSKKK